MAKAVVNQMHKLRNIFSVRLQKQCSLAILANRKPIQAQNYDFLKEKKKKRELLLDLSVKRKYGRRAQKHGKIKKTETDLMKEEV